MNSRLYRRTTAEWLPLYALQGRDYCRYVLMCEGIDRYSFAALAAMVQVGFLEGKDK